MLDGVDASETCNADIASSLKSTAWESTKWIIRNLNMKFVSTEELLRFQSLLSSNGNCSLQTVPLTLPLLFQNLFVFKYLFQLILLSFISTKTLNLLRKTIIYRWGKVNWPHTTWIFSVDFFGFWLFEGKSLCEQSSKLD